MSFRTRVLSGLRRFKPFWAVYNAWHYPKLRRNRRLYREFGVRRPVIGSIAHRYIRRPSTEVPWLDRPDATPELERSPDFERFPEAIKEGLRAWSDRGFLVAERFFDEGLVDDVNADVDRLMGEGRLGYHFRGRRIMDAAEVSDPVRRMVDDPDLLRLLGFILGRPVVLFRTINFLEGSQQGAHSDSFHMTTEPKGNLVAIWIALEDIAPEDGPVFYLPGSHRLPYVMTEDLEDDGSRFFVSETKDRAFVRKIESLIEQGDFEPVDFLPRKGDMLIWHHNLLHGGRPITGSDRTRRSLVAHFFARDVLCYHEVTERPALIADR